MAKHDLREVCQAPHQATAGAAVAGFAEKSAAKYERAVTCLAKGREALLIFHDFPAEHWTIYARPIRSRACSPR